MGPYRLLWCAALLVGAIACGADSGRRVVVYTSLDQTFSKPILTEFENRSGIAVEAVYDTEATKTTGLVNRLLAEKEHPVADVFWNSEVGRTIVLKRKGILTPYRSPSARDIPPAFQDADGCWTGFAARARVLVVNTERVPEAETPTSIFELTDPRWRGEVGLAYPLFGTTATHAAALFAALGDEKARAFFQALRANEIEVVDGNSTAKDRVAGGRLKVAFTDTDDVNVAILAGKPVRVVFPDAGGMGTLLIPNTVALVAGGPSPENGRALIDFLLSREVEGLLARSGSVQMPVREGIEVPPEVTPISEVSAMEVDFEEVADRMEGTARFLRELFVR